MQVTRTTQLIVDVPNEKGRLALVLGKVAECGVNILAYAGYVVEDKAAVILVTEDNDKVSSALKDAGLGVGQRDAVVVRADDVVGAGAILAQKISDAGVNLAGAYASAAGGEYITVYWAEDADALAAALQ